MAKTIRPAVFSGDQRKEANNRGMALVRLQIDADHLAPTAESFDLSGPAPTWVVARVRELVEDWQEASLVQHRKYYH